MPPGNTDDISLLTIIVPAFLDLAAFYTSDHKDAIAARAVVGPREPFFTKLHDELQRLNDALSTWPQTMRVPEPILARVLELFESRFVSRVQMRQRDTSPRSDTSRDERDGACTVKYFRLQMLREQLQKNQGSGISLDIIDLRRVIRVKEGRPRYRKLMIDRIADCNRELEKITKARRTAKTATKGHPTDSYGTSTTRSKLPSSKTREHADLLYRLLTLQFKCECQYEHSTIKLRLGTHRSDAEEAHFDMLFCAVTESSLKWQQAEAKIIISEGRPLLHQENRLKSSQPLKKRVEWHSDSMNPRRTVARQQRWVLEDICELIRTAAQVNSLRLNLLIDNDILYYLTASPSLERDSVQRFVSLGVFLGGHSRSQKNPVTRTGRLILMVVLANAFLHLCEGPWISEDLTKSNIYLSLINDHASPNLARLYLSTQCISLKDRKCHQKVDEVTASLQIHPYPSILSLGILLLEVELGRPLESERSQDHPNNQGVFNVISDLPEAGRMLEECEYDTSTGFVEAVQACLDESTFREEHDRNAGFDDIMFRKKIYLGVVKPLEDELQATSGLSVEDLDNLRSTDHLFRRIIDSQRRNASISSSPVVTLPPKISVRPPQLFGKSSTGTHEQEPVKVCLYDEHYTTGIATLQDSQGADGWFDNLNKRVNILVEASEAISEGQALGYEGVFSRAGNIRIAVLDTGITLPETLAWAYEDRLKDVKDFIMHEPDTASNKFYAAVGDYDGHGTHAAALLLRTAPNADVYVGRVVRDRHELHSNSMLAEVIHQRIADAIIYAATVWEVDIISLSMGFEQSISVIENAIRIAESKNIVMLAAASNSGGNSGIAWPARSDHFICVYATDSFGNRCEFTPTENPHSDNFAFLGQAVKSSWPPHLGQGDEVRKSGTSTATPIAASIGATVLAYIKSSLSRRAQPLPAADAAIFSRLRTTAGMKTVFRRMVEKRGGYDYIVPWKFLDARPQGLMSATVCDIILQDLRTQT